MYEHPIYHWPPRSQWTESIPDGLVWGGFSAYVHFPYCRNICDFCNYETRLIDKEGSSAFGDSVAREISQYAERDLLGSSQLRSVFFGGGTASLMPESALLETLSALRSLDADGKVVPEVTLECEPGTISGERLRTAVEAGVTRIGVCAQSFDDDELKRITRRHTSADALRLVDDAVAAGVENLHLDLMYGLPEQDLDRWKATLRQAVELPFTHVSAYKLYVYRHGILDRTGQVPRPEAEAPHQTAAYSAMHDAAQEILGQAGFIQYTLTEWARPGFEATYLRDTFTGGAVLPLGPSSFGANGQYVWNNPSYVRRFTDTESWRQDRRGVRLSPAEKAKRRVLLGMWLLDVDIEQVFVQEGVALSDALYSLLDGLADQGLITRTAQGLRLVADQRFGAGRPMAELAALESSAWIADPELPSRDTALTLQSSSMLSLIRMLRNDPLLFQAVADNPMTGIDLIASGLSETERTQVLNAAQHDSGPLAETWRAVRGEHRRRLVRR